jgi:hypothetical protein
MQTPAHAYFPAGYAQSRDRFRLYLAAIQNIWPAALLESLSVDEAHDLSMDWIIADANQKNDQLILLTTGEHGIEGFAGSAVLDCFMHEFLPLINPDRSGLLMVHSINPWGMSNLRRTNRGNVDINRNFVSDPSALKPGANLPYQTIDPFLNPASQPRSFTAMQFHFVRGLIASLVKIGVKPLQKAVLLGQYDYPKGIYFGGDAIQPETLQIQTLFQSSLARYQQVCLLDSHTGYGPRYQMSIVNSKFEPRESADLINLFNYPLVVKANPDEFYAIQGDMIDYFYSCAQSAYPEKTIYGTTFEFGTFGDTTLALLKSMAAMIFENWLVWRPSANDSLTQRVKTLFGSLYNPQEARWQQKAMDDARLAMHGILTAEKYI